MQNLKSLSDSMLIEKTKILVHEERRVTTSILWHLREIEARLLYAKEGYDSLFDYARSALSYSEGAAGRRIAAMRLLVEVPEAEKKLENGELSLSTLCTLQGFFKRKEEPVSREQKAAIVFEMRGKSRRECERALAAIDPIAATPPAERERVISSTETEIRFVADEALMEKLKRIRELDAHHNDHPSYLELFHRMADLALKKLDPEQKKPKVTPPAKSKADPASKTADSRYIPAHMKRAIWKRDHGSCTYVSQDGQRCSSRFAVQVDHITPIAQEGKTELANLRLLCRAHNRQQAVEKLGTAAMRPYFKFPALTVSSLVGRVTPPGTKSRSFS